MKKSIIKLLSAATAVFLITACCSLSVFAVPVDEFTVVDLTLRPPKNKVSANSYAVNAETTSKQYSFDVVLLKEYITYDWDILGGKVNIGSYNITLDEFTKIYFALLFEKPEYFYVTNKFSCFYDKDTRIVSAFSPTYICEDKTQLVEMQTNLNTAIFDLIDCIDENMTLPQKILAAHDNIIMNCEYDVAGYYDGTPSSEYVSTAYGCLVEHIALCEGYTKAFALIMDYFGVETSYVKSDTMGHAWNMVKVDGNYYHVDLTWDDSLAIVQDKYYNQAGNCLHKYFLKTDLQMQQGAHTGWKAEHTSEVQLSGMWDGVGSCFYYINGVYYYVGSTGEITSYNNLTKKTTSLYKIADSEWGRVENSYYKWLGSSARLAYGNGRMYFNTNTTVYELNMQTGAVAEVYKPTINQNCINGVVFLNNKLCYDMLGKTAYLSKVAINSGINKISYSANAVNFKNGTVMGDINGSGSVNSKDLLYLRKQLSTENIVYSENSDLNRDGKINAKDVLVLRSYLANIIYIL